MATRAALLLLFSRCAARETSGAAPRLLACCLHRRRWLSPCVCHRCVASVIDPRVSVTSCRLRVSGLSGSSWPFRPAFFCCSPSDPSHSATRSCGQIPSRRTQRNNTRPTNMRRAQRRQYDEEEEEEEDETADGDEWTTAAAPSSSSAAAAASAAGGGWYLPHAFALQHHGAGVFTNSAAASAVAPLHQAEAEAEQEAAAAAAAHPSVPLSPSSQISEAQSLLADGHWTDAAVS